ncbi:MAG: winged helix-turn-helix domain-containing protein [Lewinellaceae bacterium]|nr:winged helix-turn-helix domain-containing protein [Lewinellaceae bacterium]
MLSSSQSIENKTLDQQPDLVIICDSSKEEQGIARLEEVKTRFPNLPLFLIVEDPSKAFLMAALRFKVSRLFTLPLDVDEFRHAILQVVKKNKKIGTFEKIGNWFYNFQQHAQSLMSALSEPDNEHEEYGAEEVWPKNPHPYLHLPNTKLETDRNYDMSVQFFGNLNIEVREKPKPHIRGTKNTTVLAYLLFHHHRLTHREILMEKFWCDISPSCAKNSLNVAICSLRKNLMESFPNQDVIVFDNQSYGINPEMKVITDTEKFIYHWKAGNAIESEHGLAAAISAYNNAVDYYKDEFLSNLRLENWCEYERDNLKEIYLYILNKLGIHFFGLMEYDTCINIGKKMLREDICLEEVHRKLMRSYYLLGQPDLAHLQYFKCKKALQEELNLKPSEPTVELFNRIQNGKPVS